MPIISRAKDLVKDQTYFIWQIKKEQLSHILFPVGEFENKAEVREYAKAKNLITSQKPDSQGLCFVGQTSLRDMLLQTIGQKNGYIYTYLSDTQAKKIGIKITKKNLVLKTKQNSEQHKIKLGEHQGAFLYTIGQRQNLGLSNGPWFVQNVDIINNEVTVCHNDYKQDMNHKSLWIKEINWHIDINNFVNSSIINTKDNKNSNIITIKAQCQIRYHGQSNKVVIFYNTQDNTAFVLFEDYVNSPANGQSIVFYDYETNTEMLCGGIIYKTPSLFLHPKK